MRFNNKLFLIVTAICVIICGCKKFLDVDLDKSLIDIDKVFSNDITATSAMTGVYYTMLDQQGFISGSKESISTVTGLSADELVSYSPDAAVIALYQNSLEAQNSSTLILWNTAYKTIYGANAVLEGVKQSSALTENTRKQLMGEALFVRALSHFYLTNLFGKIPLVTNTDYNTNHTSSRADTAVVYDQIITDLQEAAENLGTAYITGEKVRPNKASAQALLARVYLYQKKWAEAEQTASLVINNPAYSLPDQLDAIFTANSGEAIWQLRPVSQYSNAFEGYFFILQFSPVNNYVTSSVLSNELLTAFEPGDLRKSSWIGMYTDVDNTPVVDYYYPYKYKQQGFTDPLIEYSTLLRVGEQYLIRAEARAEQGKIQDGKKDVDTLRKRAGLLPLAIADKFALLNAIEHERRVELFTEGGHRWLDLKRWGLATQRLSGVKTNWNNEDVLYPIPQTEIDKNTHLKPQNAGYN